jgi:lysophospholipid acyltransferase (LPLAT)-like uncharacterized protein
MKITHPLLTKSLGLLGATALRALTGTLDYRIVYEDPRVDPVHPGHERRGIYLLWHEYMICPLGVRGKGLTVLVSQHRDGELITQIMRHLGFRAIRGSSTRGGVAAVRRMLRGNPKSEIRNLGRNSKSEAPNPKQIQNPKSETNTTPSLGHSNLGFVSDFEFRASDLIVTPDGPRGPRRRLAEGAIYLASRLQLPIVCMGFGFDRPWRLSSWDRFAIPRPFSRARAVISPYLEFPADLGRDEGMRKGSHEPRMKHGTNTEGHQCLIRVPSVAADPSSLEYWRLRVEQVLNHVTQEAERWAESGRRKRGEMPFLRHEPAPEMMRLSA